MPSDDRPEERVTIIAINWPYFSALHQREDGSRDVKYYRAAPVMPSELAEARLSTADAPSKREN